MINKKILILFVLLLGILVLHSASAEHVGKEAWNNASEGDRFANCSKFPLLFNIFKLRNNYLPTTFTNLEFDEPHVKDTLFNWALSQVAGFGFLVKNVLMKMPTNPFVLAGTAIVSGYMIFSYLDRCSSSYVLLPHELINQKKGYNGSNKLTADDIPFYYHCDPTWDPNLGRNVDINTDQGKAVAGRTIGYLGGYHFCPESCGRDEYENCDFKNGSNSSGFKIPGAKKHLANYHDYMKRQVGTIHVETYPIVARMLDKILETSLSWLPGPIKEKVQKSIKKNFRAIAGNDYVKWAIKIATVPLSINPINIIFDLDSNSVKYQRLNPVKGHKDYLSAYSYSFLPASRVQGYYSIEGGKMKVCAAELIPGVPLPIKYGCHHTASPGEGVGVKGFVESLGISYCRFLFSGRGDLKALGDKLESANPNNNDSRMISTVNFLKGEWHFASTIIGCMDDMIAKMFRTKRDDTPLDGTSFFKSVQSNFKPIIQAALVLYFCMIGFTLITSGQQLQKSQFMKYIITLTIVVYFGMGQGLRENEPGSFISYQGLRNISNQLIGFFLNTDGDTYSCYYPDELAVSDKDGSHLNILRDHVTTATVPVRLSVWDFLDCKLGSYFSFGTCQYSTWGLLGSIINLNIFDMFFKNILFFLSFFSYIIVILAVILRLIYIVIMSSFALAILLLLAPIFITFALFQSTYNIFQAWLKMAFGYMLYPAFIFAVFALMISSFDALVYGELKNGDTWEQKCNGVDSMFCAVAKARDYNVCSYKPFQNNWNADAYSGENAKTLLTLVLFAFLFFFFLAKVIDAMAYLLNVVEFSSVERMASISDMASKVKESVSKGDGSKGDKDNE